MGDFTRDLLYYGGINAYTGSMKLPGNVVFEGKGSYMPTLDVNQLIVTGNAAIPNISYDSLTIAGNVISGGNFIGNGALITGVFGTLPSKSNIDIIGNVAASGNASAQFFVGNGAGLTGISVSSLAARGKADIFGNVTASGNVIVGGRAVVLGNVSANYIYGNGALLTGVKGTLPTTFRSDVVGNVTAPGDVVVAGQISAIGNISGAYIKGNGVFLTGFTATLPTNVNIDIIGNVSAPGNVSAKYFFGNGSQMTGVVAILPSTANTDIVGNVSAPGNITIAGRVVAVGNVSANYLIGNGALLTGVIAAAATIPSSIRADVVGNVTAPGDIIAGTVTAAGNVAAAYFKGNGSLLTGLLTDLPPIANMDIRGNVTAPGNVSARYFFGNGSGVTGITSTTLPTKANIDITSGNITSSGNLTVVGGLTAAGNITAINFIGNGAFLTGVQANLPTVATMDIIGNVTTPIGGDILVVGDVTATGNIATGVFFRGNGSQLTGVLRDLPPVANINIIGNVTAPGNIAVAGQVVAAGNISAGYFKGNGALLTGFTSDSNMSFTANGKTISTTNLTITTDNYLDVSVANNTAIFMEVTGVNTGGNLLALNANADVFQQNLAGYALVPKGKVANEQARLALDGGNAAVGSLVTETNTGDTFLLVASPSNVTTNWVGFNGGNFPVTSVFDRFGSVVAQYGDYADNYIILSSAVGNVPAGNSVAQAVASLQTSKANITNGNISASYFVGNGSQLSGLTGIIAVLPPTANIDITGNVIAPGNVSVAGQVIVTGNVAANYFIGNGYRLSGVVASLPKTGNTNIKGNVTAPGLIQITGTGFIGVGGNATANYFIGNAAQIDGIIYKFPPTVNTNIVGNVATPTNGSITVFGKANIAGDVITNGYFRGDGLNVTGTNQLSGGILTGNLDSSGAHIFTSQTPFMWNSGLFGDPTKGTEIVTAVAVGSSGSSYIGPWKGWRFTPSSLAGTFGTLAWNVQDFDFTKDFQVYFSVFASNYAGEMWISVGGRDDGGTVNPLTHTTGQLIAHMNLINIGTAVLYDNLILLNSTNTVSLVASQWWNYSFSVRTIAGKRYATLVNVATGVVIICGDASNWTPLGGWLVIGAQTPSNILCEWSINNVNMEYL